MGHVDVCGAHAAASGAPNAEFDAVAAKVPGAHGEQVRSVVVVAGAVYDVPAGHVADCALQPETVEEVEESVASGEKVPGAHTPHTRSSDGVAADR